MLPPRFNALDFQTRPHQNNLSPSEKRALLHLTKWDEIIIIPADKGGAVVVWSRPLYDAETHRQLSDGRFYERLDHDDHDHDAPTLKHT